MQRFTSLDTYQVCAELAPLIEGSYLHNIYDGQDASKSTIILKFSKRDLKYFLEWKAGQLFYATTAPSIINGSNSFSDTKQQQPSHTCLQLKKLLRDKRCTRLVQHDFDRRLFIEFGHPQLEKSVVLCVELFGLGNLVVVGGGSIESIISSSSPHSSGGEGDKRVFGDHVDDKGSPLSTVKCVWRKVPGCAVPGAPYKTDTAHKQLKTVNANDISISGSEIENMRRDEKMRRVLCKRAFPLFTPAMLDYCAAVKDDYNLMVERGNWIVKMIAERRLPLHTSEAFGLRIKDDGTDHDDPNMQLSYNQCIDKHQQQLNQSIINRTLTNVKNKTSNKLAAIKASQEAHINKLRTLANNQLVYAQAIQCEQGSVDEVIGMVRVGILEMGIGWVEMEELVREEQEKGNPSALMIDSLQLSKDTINIGLYVNANTGADQDCIDHQTSPSLQPQQQSKISVPVNIHKSAHANAQAHYQARKQTLSKLEKTIAAQDHALASAQANILSKNRQKSKGSSKNATLQARNNPFLSITASAKRKPFWFERFNWFKSSDGLLVIGGKDAHQNEWLVKRLLRPGDAYVHADIAGASSVIVKGPPSSETPMVASDDGRDASDESTRIPLQTLQEAGTFALCMSRAWTQKIVTSAWWVPSHQVSKSAPTGEYLSVGSFMVRGKKRWLGASALKLAFGFLYYLGEDGCVDGAGDLDAFVDNHDDAAVERKSKKYTALIEENPVATFESPPPSTNCNQEAVTITHHEHLRPSSYKRQHSPNTSAAPPTAAITEKAKGKVRGKHGKNKKIKGKYKDQDEEERMAKMKLLGHQEPKIEEIRNTTGRRHPGGVNSLSKGLSKTQIDSKDKETGKEVEIVVGKTEVSVLKSLVCSLPHEDESVDVNEKAIKEGGPSTTATKEPAITPKFIALVPMLAPPSAFSSSSKLKVILQPGPLKRGQAIKQAISLILAKDNGVGEIEAAGIRACGEAELCARMMAGVKIVDGSDDGSGAGSSKGGRGKRRSSGKRKSKKK